MPGTVRDSQIRTILQQLQQHDAIDSQQTAGTTIEVINTSAAPEAAYHNAQANKLKADQWGSFQGELPGVQAGDHLRVRARTEGGQVSQWISLQVPTDGDAGEDRRNAQIGPRGLGIKAQQDGALIPVQLGPGMLSEPGAQLQLTNQRTGESFRFTLDENGRIPAGTTLQGQAGDDFQIAVNDGRNNNDFSFTLVNSIQARTEVNLEDPNASRSHSLPSGAPRIQKVRFQGPLFLEGASAADVKQGSLGNCYFCAAAAAVAHTRPDLIENMMKDNGDGTYTVTFNVEQPPNSGQYQPKDITVDGEIYVSGGTRPQYGSAPASGNPTQDMEMWFPILEKAYAALKDNSYQGIESGWSHKMMMMFAGSQTNDEHFLPNSQPDQLFESLKQAEANGWSGTAVTYDKSAPENSRYAGSRIYASHAYSLMGVHEENGEKFVRVRNPWGSSEPGYDGKDDGVFLLPIDKFTHFFQWANVTHIDP